MSVCAGVEVATPNMRPGPLSPERGPTAAEAAAALHKMWFSSVVDVSWQLATPPAASPLSRRPRGRSGDWDSSETPEGIRQSDGSLLTGGPASGCSASALAIARRRHVVVQFAVPVALRPRSCCPYGHRSLTQLARREVNRARTPRSLPRSRGCALATHGCPARAREKRLCNNNR